MTATFAELGVPARIVAALAGEGVTDPFPIQAATLPDSLAGRDVLGRGRTGSGKTIAFAVPLIAALGGRLAGGARRSGRPLGLVLAPTRELATQIAAVLEPLAVGSGLSVTTIFGGVSMQRQIDVLRRGVDIVVACPGRLEDLMRQRALTLDAVEITVLDEADHMADLGFLPQVTRILAATPGDGQRLLFSATLDNGVDVLVRRFLHSPITHSVDDAAAVTPDMQHAVLEVADAASKRRVLKELASGADRRILFVRTKHVAKRLARELAEAGVAAVDLQGNLSQNARDRNLAAFAAGEARVLVATDVAARGVHVDDVSLVVHVDPPTEHKAYLHRSGRTARAGASGTVVTLTLPEQRRDVAVLLRKAGVHVVPVAVTAESREVTDLVGERAALVAPPAPLPVQQQRRPARAAEPRRGEQRRTDERPARGRGVQGARPAHEAGRGGQRRTGAPAQQPAGARRARSTYRGGR